MPNMGARGLARGDGATIVYRMPLPNSLLNTLKTVCCCFSVILLFSTISAISLAYSLEVSASQTGAPITTAPTGLTNEGNSTTATVQAGPSSTGDRLASMNDSSAEKTQQSSKSLESFLRTSLSSNVNELITKPSQNGLETSTSANTAVVTSSPAPVATGAATAPAKTMANGAQNSHPLPQTKSLKFTLIAGKSWKFVIKGNSLSGHNRAELRLHKNVSTNNYIIDDEGWFQYNPQQQQLFAWPNLATKSGTYYFVLLPSGIDFEAESENIVNLEVAASIVVELIKPLYQGAKTGGNIEQLIDYEFSLENLHRHPAYPLLLNQIFSVFETLAKSSNTTTSTSQQIATTNSPSLLTTISPNQQVAVRSSNKLSEYLLLKSSYSQDGELFSLTWSTHPALLNNTITPISECRVNSITDTISKLSNLSAGYQSDEEKSTILFGLEAPQSGSQAIVPTERSNALKLVLNGPCREAKIIEELGIQQQVGKVAGAILSADDNENNVADNKSQTTSTAAIKTSSNSTTNSPNAPGSEALVTSTANQITPSGPLLSNSSSQIAGNETTTVTPQILAGTNQPRSILYQSGSTDSVSEDSTSPSSSPPSLGTEPPVIKTSNTPLQQPKLQPQAKSLEDFLEMSDIQPSATPTSGSPELTSSTQQSNLTLVNSFESTTISSGVSVVPTKTVTPVSAESTLNEDFMGILDEVMNYLISVAVPASIIVGSILLLSIIFALCHLYRKRKKSKEFQVRNRFDFRYSSERKGFLKNRSRPVILEADQKSLSMGGTPQHKATTTNSKQKITDEERKHYLPMSTMYYEASGASGSAGVDSSRGSNVQEKHE